MMFVPFSEKNNEKIKFLISIIKNINERTIPSVFIRSFVSSTKYLINK